MIGEVHTSILMDNYLTLQINAVVVTRLKAGLIVGMTFTKRYKIVIDIPNSCLIFPGEKLVNFNNKPGNPKTSLLRADVNNVIFPGDSLILPTPTNFIADTNIAVEPRKENISWPEPCIIENKDGCVTIFNHLDKPIKLKRNQVIAQVRSVIDPSQLSILETTEKSEKHDIPQCAYTKSIAVDPDNVLTDAARTTFNEINKDFSTVFSPQIGTYNDTSGKPRASVCMGTTLPTPKKGKVPCYNTKTLSILQEKFDELVHLGVLSRPEGVDVQVIHTSPSFLVKKTWFLPISYQLCGIKQIHSTVTIKDVPRT